MRTFPKRIWWNRQGFSLLEMVLASLLMIGVLVPALAIVRDALTNSRDLHQRNLLSNYAVHLLEEHLAVVAVDWNTGLWEGSLGGVGHPDLRYSVSRSDSPTAGGIEDRLMNIQVTVFDDKNGNGMLDGNEPRVTYQTKIANMESYDSANP